MSTAIKLSLSDKFAQLYQNGLTLHSDVGVSFDAFEKRLAAVIEKHLGLEPALQSVFAFLSLLHISDLYLATGCSAPNDCAWRRFVSLYGKYINDISRSVTSSSDVGGDLAADVLSNLFLHDRSGRSRIASYDGQQSLSTWLVAVISHRAANEALRKSTRFEPLDLLVGFQDLEKVNKIEADLRASSYHSIIINCFKVACDSLTERERLVLLMRFDDGLRIVEIGRHFKVHPTGITRLLQRTYEKLRRRMISHLTNTNQLGPTAVKECLTDILENPEHSIIALIRDTTDTEKERSIG